MGAFYVWVHRQYVIFMRSNKKMNMFLQKKYETHPFNLRTVFINWVFTCSRFLYPGIVALIVASVSYPLGTGQFVAGELSTHEQVHQLFKNFTWTADDLTVEQLTIVNHWSTKYTDIFFHLSAFLIFTVRNLSHDPISTSISLTSI